MCYNLHQMFTTLILTPAIPFFPASWHSSRLLRTDILYCSSDLFSFVPRKTTQNSRFPSHRPPRCPPHSFLSPLKKSTLYSREAHFSVREARHDVAQPGLRPRCTHFLFSSIYYLLSALSRGGFELYLNYQKRAPCLAATGRLSSSVPLPVSSPPLPNRKSEIVNRKSSVSRPPSSVPS